VSKLHLYTQQNLNKLRQVTDELSDLAVKDFIQNPWMAQEFNLCGHLTSLDFSSFSPPIQHFFKFFLKAPDFVQPSKIKLAQDYFEKNGSLYLMLLGLYSLPYCYAFADGAQVLYRSKRITSDIGNRLAETALFVLDAFRPGAFIDQKVSIISLAKVRMIHSFGRYFIQHHANDWNTEWGKPINQEDLLGTNLAFSLLVIRGLDKLGKSPGKQVYESLLHYWKVIGWYLGLDITYWPDTAKEAFELELLIRKRHLKSSIEGRFLLEGLMNHFISEIEGVGSREEIASTISYFLGEEASAALGINHQLILPKSMIGLLFNMNLIKTQKRESSYEQIRQDFNLRFSNNIQLKIPVMRP
jgi:hypothetical protein